MIRVSSETFRENAKAADDEIIGLIRVAGSGDPRAEIDAVMRAYALRVGHGSLAERFWRLAPAPSRAEAATRPSHDPREANTGPGPRGLEQS